MHDIALPVVRVIMPSSGEKQGKGRIFIYLFTVMTTLYRQLHSVDLTTRTLDWESVHKMAAKTLLTVFYAGSPTTGSHMVVALQEGHTPLIYRVVGQYTCQCSIVMNLHLE